MNDDTEPTLELRPTSTKPQPTVSPPQPGPGDFGPIDPALRSLAEIAASDLAVRLGVDESTIEVATAEIVTWPDNSLGCPQPGMAYLQVPVDGMRILLLHEDAIFSYHAGGRTFEPFLCEQPDTGVVGSPAGDVAD